jgi:cytoskeleton protein RodZ
MAEARTRDVQPKRVGERLAAARAALKLELEDIAERSRIPLRHLQAIEASNFEALPASTYSIGFVKTFARMVGLDGNEIATAFRAERGDTLAQREEYTPFEPADPSRVPPNLLVMIALGTAVVLLIAYLIWRGAGSNDERQQMAAGTSPEASTPAAPAATANRPASAKPALPAPSPADKVILTASENVWVKISEKDGPTLFMGELTPGQNYEVPADAKDPRLLTGRPQVLSARIGARVIPELGSAKRSISNVSLKGPALIERDEAMKAAEADRSASVSATAPPTAPADAIDRSPPANANQASTTVATPAAP